MSTATVTHFSTLRLAVAVALIVLFCAAAALTIVGGTSGGADVLAVIE